MPAAAPASICALTVAVVFALPPLLLHAAAQQTVGAPRDAPAAGAPPTAPGSSFRPGGYERTLDGFVEPLGVAIDRTGTILVAEAGAARVARAARDGRRLEALTGPLREPVAVTLLDDDRIAVLDRARRRVEVFRPDGTHAYGFGGRGESAGRFIAPVAIAASGDRIAVADAGARRVSIFTAAGEPLLTIERAGDAALGRPAGCAYMPDGTLLVADGSASRILRFDTAGRFTGAFGAYGPFDGLLDDPAGLAWHGVLLVADMRNHRIALFDDDGGTLGSFGVHALVPREGEGRFHYPESIAVAPDGSFAVIGESFEDRLQVIRALLPGETPPEAPWEPGLIPRQTHFGQYASADGPLLAITEPEAHSVWLFHSARRIPIGIAQFGERGSGAGLYVDPMSLALCTDSRDLFVVDAAQRRLERLTFDFDATAPIGFSTRRLRLVEARSFDQLEGAGVHEPLILRDGGAGSLYALDPRRGRLLRIDRASGATRVLGGEAPPFVRATDFAVDVSGVLADAEAHMLVVDGAARSVLRIGADGQPLGVFAGAEHLGDPFGVSIGADGLVHVTDRAAGRVLVFDADGTWRGSFGSRGEDPGQLWKPAGIVRDGDGRVHVIDHGNHRMQIFSPDGTWLVIYGTGRAYTPESPPPVRRPETRGPLP
ncbi:MAG: NHL repeat-containing protein [Phycisphaeraceae bacterium]|nr:NHL repeat-containing protein [Phycisphaeraceae bacterium]